MFKYLEVYAASIVFKPLERLSWLNEILSLSASDRHG